MYDTIGPILGATLAACITLEYFLVYKVGDDGNNAACKHSFIGLKTSFQMHAYI